MINHLMRTAVFVLLAFLVWQSTGFGWLILTAVLTFALRHTIPFAFSTAAGSWFVVGGMAAVTTTRWWFASPADFDQGVLVSGAFTNSLALFFLLLCGADCFRKIRPGFDSTRGSVFGLFALFFSLNQTMESADRATYLLLTIGTAIGLAAGFSKTTEDLAGLGDGPGDGHGRFSRKGPRRKTTIWRGAIFGMCLTLVALASWVFAISWGWMIVRAQTVLPQLIVRAESRSSSAVYVRSGKIGSISLEQRINPLSIAMTVYADKTPGYLRGRAFDTYQNSEWFVKRLTKNRGRRKWSHLDDKIRFEPVADYPEGIGAADLPERGQSVFSIQPVTTPSFSSTEFKRIEIRNNPRRGRMYFTPLGMNYLQGEGYTTSVDRHGVVYSGIKHDSPYVAYVAASGETPKQEMPDRLRQQLLQLPERYRDLIRETGDQICEDRESSREKIYAVSRHIRNNWDYQPEAPELGNEGDPVVQFLMNKIPANCEFFASATILLLRAQGIPCRYVTGYVVTEIENDEEEYFIARNRDAHAWVEAWVDETNRWVTVESTPGVSFEVANRDASQLADSGGPEKGIGDLANFRELWLATVGRFFVDWSGWILLASMSALVWLVVRHFVWARRTPECRFLPESHCKMHRQLQRQDRQLRRHGLVRRSDETLHQFATRIERHSLVSVFSERDLQTLAHAADWYREYAVFRYSCV